MKRLILCLVVSVCLISSPALGAEHRIPGAILTLKAAMSDTSVHVGDTLVVESVAGGWEGGFTIKDGVEVIPAPGHSPVIDGTVASIGSGPVVTFPANAASGTVLDGFTIKANTTTTRIVEINDDGILKNCTIEGTNVTGQVAVYHTCQTSTVAISENVTILLDDSASGVKGVELEDSNFKLRNWDIRIPLSSGSYGVHCLSGFDNGTYREYPNIENTYISVPGGTGVELPTTSSGFGSGKVSQTTVSGHAGTGIKVSSDTEVTKCIVADGTGMGIVDVHGAVGKVTLTMVENAFNLSGHLDAQHENKVEDPEWVDGVSPSFVGYAFQNSTFEPLGFSLSATLHGTLLSSSTWKTEWDEMILDADFTIPSGVELTIEKDSDLRALAGEIIVKDGGDLDVSGTSTQKVSFQGDTSVEGLWDGIRVEEGGTLNLDDAIVAHAKIGVHFEDNAHPGGSHTISGSHFFGNEFGDILVDKSTVVGGASHNYPLIDENTIDVGDSGYGIKLVECDYVKVSNTVVNGATGTSPSNSLPGIEIGSESGPVVLEGNVVSSFDGQAALLIRGGDANVIQNTLSNSKYGIEIKAASYAAPTIGGIASNSDNLIFGNTSNGIRVEGNSNSTSPPASNTNPVIRNNQMYSNNIGIYTFKNAAVDLGSSSTNAYNSIWDNTLYCIWNRNKALGIEAWGNWFGSCNPASCWNGAVLTYSNLCSQPASFGGPGTEIGREPSRPSLSFSANPIQGSTVITFQGNQGVESKEFQIFDIAGRVVKRLPVSGVLARASWDGTDTQGKAVSNGIYFVRVLSRTNDIVATQKTVVAR